MNPMVRSVVAITGGLVAAFVLIMLGQAAGSPFFPAPAGTDTSDPDSMRRAMRSLPVAAFLVVLAAYALGSLVGGWVAARFAPKAPLAHALGVGAILTFAGVVNLTSLPHPAWFWVVNLPEFILFAWLGAQVAAPRRTAELAV
jgi:hypothetical protein